MIYSRLYREALNGSPSEFSWFIFHLTASVLLDGTEPSRSRVASPCIWKCNHFGEFKFDSIHFMQRDCRYTRFTRNFDFFLYFASFPF